MKQEVKSNAKYVHRIVICLDDKQVNYLRDLIVQSYHRSYGSVIRDIIDNKKIRLNYHDTTLDDLMFELGGYLKYLKLMSINMNQITRCCINQQMPADKLVDATKVIEFLKEFEPQIKPVCELINKIGNIWLQE